MAHIAKFKKGAVGHMLEHYDRSAGTKISNPEVDLNNAHLNYNLAQAIQPERQLEFIHKRLEQVKVQKRKDVNVLSTWVVTAPNDLPSDEREQFFLETYRFLEKRYGQENVVSSWVHMDETTPHMHFAFIPITKDDKKGGYKVSAKEVITRTDLNTFHPDLQKHLEKQLGHEVRILNDATKEGNQSVGELKRETAKKELEEQTQRIEKLKEVKVLKPKLMKPVEPTVGIFGKETVDYDEYQKKIREYNKLLKAYAEQKTALMAYEAENICLKNDLEHMQGDLKSIINSNPYQVIKTLKSQNKSFATTIDELKEQITKSLATQNELEKILDVTKYDLETSNIVLERSCSDIVDRFQDRESGWEHLYKNVFKMDKDSANKLNVFKMIFNFKEPFGKEALKSLDMLKGALGLPSPVRQAITKLVKQVFRTVGREI